MNKNAVAEMSLQYQVEAAQKLVPEGYKQTEVGVIPEDWGVGSLHSVAAIERGKFSARPRNDPKYYGGEYPFLQTGDIAHSKGRIKSFTQTLNGAGLVVSRLFPKGTLFFTIAANIGDVGIADFEAACPDSIVGIIPRGKNSQEWLLYELASRQEEFELLASPGAQLNLNLEKLRPFLIPVPTVKEQAAIANALSDTDALLSELEKLIAKKQAIKTATMQQLLTGRTRLPQFAYHPDGSKKGYKQSELGEIPEDWIIAAIADQHEIATGNTPPTSDIRNYGGNYLFVSPADLGNKKCIDKAEKTLSNKGFALARKFPAGSTLFTCIGSTIGKTGYATVDLTSNQQINAVFPNENHDSNFTYYALTYIAPKIKVLAGEQAVPLVNKTAFGQTLYYLPKKKQEQTAIATILADMDEEIQALEHRLNKTRQIKQGMMQELLTGKTRLVVPQD